MKKKFSVQTQFFLTYIVIAALVILSFSLFFSKYISEILMERETNSFENLSRSFMEQTDMALHDMDDVSLNIGYSNLVLQKLDDYFASDSVSSSQKNHEFSDLVELFVAINGADYKVSQINVYAKEGYVITVGPYTNVRRYDPEQLLWTAAADKAKGHKVISQPYQSSKMLSNSSVSLDYFSLYRPLYDSYGRPIGYVETVQTCKKIFKSIISYINSNRRRNSSSIYVFNGDGQLIYPYTAKEQENIPWQHYYDQATESSDSTLCVNPLTGETELITSVTSPYSSWTFLCAQDESIILAPVVAFGRIMILVIILVSIFVLIFSYWMSKGLTRPIHQLLGAFHQTKIDTLGYVKKESMKTSFNEFDELNDAFYQMSDDLKNSMNALIETRQQELKSRSLALQSQINPHFYYNSLSSITVLAENGQTQEVISFSRNLTSMMRYITNGNMQIVTMLAEITYVQKYMYCMKVRYQSSLNYDIQVDSRLHNIEIPKLLIQPIVENALKYGTDCEPPWYLEVTSEITDTHWLIHVCDRGPGFNKEALSLIESRFLAADKTIGMPETKIDGLGMVNVYQRWKLFCPDSYIFKYENRENGGSKVSIGKYEVLEKEELI